jgi:hypothetical protein
MLVIGQFFGTLERKTRKERMAETGMQGGN